MYCRKCGIDNNENAYKCVACGEVLQHGSPTTTPAKTIPNYLVYSILVTLFCCLPLGIPAIVFSAGVNGKIAAGDIAGALEASRKAKAFCWWSFGLGLAVSAVYFVIGALGAMNES